MSEASPPFEDPNVERAFAAFPGPERAGLLAIRNLIFETAAECPEAGEILETLKWGQPSYLTPETKSGSTIRLGLSKLGGFAIFTHCQSTLMSDFQSLFGEEFTFEGNRAVVFDDSDALQPEKLRLLIRNALTYHLKR